ncbi:MAG: histidinol dehydrogenase [Lentisphaeria bacterium]|jgi:histidinol dehydrogenase|nr:histidinol dehydrogenase [Lentisphaeria bacterium]
MMKTINYQQDCFAAELEQLLRRTPVPAEIHDAVATILRDVEQRGDAAICEYAAKFDKVDLSPDQFRLTAGEIEKACGLVAASTRDAIDLAYRNVTDFAGQRRLEDWSFAPRPGVSLGERFRPLSRVAAYVPGGAAPLVSTVIHTIAMAGVAGVAEIAVTSPATADGTINPAIVYAAITAGATEIYRLGGVYAIAALAYGTETVRPVEKIVGPGNAYVTAAKKQVYGTVALDLVAGPSEVMIIADQSASPAFIAADMLAQAEHGSGLEKAVLLTDFEPLLEKVVEEVRSQAEQLGRREAVQAVLDNGIYLVCLESIEQAVDVANRYAPEHLEIMTEAPRDTAAGIVAAGAVFLGPWTPEPVGDFVAGPSHVLPTGGTARFFSGLTVDQFYRRTSIVEYDRDALAAEADAVAEFARVEELDAHGRSVAIRFTDNP